MKSFQIAQPVVFWKWITPSKLGLVTATTVYHWDMNVRSPAALCGPRLASFATQAAGCVAIRLLFFVVTADSRQRQRAGLTCAVHNSLRHTRTLGFLCVQVL